MTSFINFTTLASGALGFTLALAWNDAVVKTIQSLFPPKDERAAARATIAYAIVVTILVILLVSLINCAKRAYHKLAPAKDAEGFDGPGRRQHSQTQGGGSRRPAPPPIVRLWEPGDS